MRLNQIMSNLLTLSNKQLLANCYIKFWTCRTFMNIAWGYYNRYYKQAEVKNSFNSKLFQRIFLLNSNKPIKSFQLEKLANQSIFNDVFMIEMININSFHKSKNNFRLIKRKSSNRKNMDSENILQNCLCKEVLVS